ncbi:MAG: branched-chain amino acid ABC transporter permease [Chloroflexota bacterium]
MVELSSLASQMLNGFVLGMIYVLVALGMSIIIGMVGIVNFAHGVFFAVGAYFAYEIEKVLGIGGALIISPILVGVLGMLIEMSLFRRLYNKDALLGLLLTFGLSLVGEQLLRIIWGTAGKPFHLPPDLASSINFFGISYSEYRLVVLVGTVALVLAIWLVLEKTPYGRIIRAGSRDPEMISMLGIDLSRIFTLVLGLGTLTAGVAGVVAAPLWGVQPSMGTGAIMPAFVIVTLGGLGSFWGPVIGGIIVGEAISLSVLFFPPISETIMYILMAAVLLVRPRGIMGEKWERFEA